MNNEKLTPESKKEVPLEIVPAEGLGTKNYIKITEGTIPSINELISLASRNEAVVDNSDDEAGDDQFAIQFPGKEPELLEYDQVAGSLRELSGEYDE